MSNSGQFITQVKQELFAIADGVTRTYPLMVAGKPVRNVRGAPKIYSEDWQGRVELSSKPRTNYAKRSTYPADGSTGGTTPPIVTVHTTHNGLECSKITIPAHADSGFSGCRAGCLTHDDMGLTEGDGFTMGVLVWISRPVVNGERYFIYFTPTAAGVTRLYIDDSVPAGAWIYLSQTTDSIKQNIASGVLSLAGAGGPDPIEIYITCSQLVRDDIVGAYIPTDDHAVTRTDYTYNPLIATVTTPAPLPQGTRLYWSGELVFDSDPSLLPTSAVHGVKVVENAISSMASLAVPLRDLWNPYTCPLELLPWLAWALSIDAWKSYWPEHIKRQRVATALEIQRHKGTVQSVLNVINSFGGAVQLREWWQKSPPGDPHTFDMILTLGAASGTATSAQYVDDVIAEVTRTKPVRSHFTFTQGITAAAKIGVASVARPVAYRRMNFQAA